MTFDRIWRRIAWLYGSGEAKSIARILLDDMFGLSLADIVCGAVEKLSDADTRRLSDAVDRLEKGEPVQYVTGKTFFADREFAVAPGVLIPRLETEQLCSLVEQVMQSDANDKSVATNVDADEKVVKDFTIDINYEANSGTPLGNKHKILDIGTGSGCIAITLALDMPECSVSAWDVSPEALTIAEGNAKRLGATVNFSRQDALSAPQDEDKWDAIVSNPPYICKKESVDMERNVLEHEPHLALFVPDDDPLLFYRNIARYAQKALKEGGMLFFEINSLYAKETEQMLAEEGFAEIKTVKDIYGKERNTICRKKTSR